MGYSTNINPQNTHYSTNINPQNTHYSTNITPNYRLPSQENPHGVTFATSEDASSSRSRSSSQSRAMRNVSLLQQNYIENSNLRSSPRHQYHSNVQKNIGSNGIPLSRSGSMSSRSEKGKK